MKERNDGGESNGHARSGCHPALRGFPTEFHSNWQRWPIVMHSRSLILDHISAGFRPIVQVIDNFERNHKMGPIFEAAVGDGALHVCSSDLLFHQDKPEARQLLRSLIDYMGSERSCPQHRLEVSDNRPNLCRSTGSRRRNRT